MTALSEETVVDRDETEGTYLTVDDLRWLGCALTVGTLVAAAYLFTHPYPAYGAGLYMHIAQQIAENGYHLPRTIPNYTAEGVPFAYPPLVFYASAVILDRTAVGPIALSRFLPAALTLAYLVPYYFVARELLDRRSQAGLATMLLAVTPPTLQWHLSAGGVVRATAFLLVVTGLYTGIHLFRSGRPRWIGASTVLFGLTVLTHPVYTAFFGVSYLLFYLAFDRSLLGLISGAIVALGGVVIAAPWWLQIVKTHGPSAFAAAAGTHTGLFGGVGRLFDQFAYPLVMGPPVPLFFVLSFAGMFYFLGKRRLLLPAWLIVGAVVIGKERFQFVAGSMMAAVFLLAAVRKVARHYLADQEWRRGARLAVSAILLTATVIAAMFGAGALPDAHAGSPSQPQFMDQSDERMMEWVERNTAQSADFVVLGDAAEWFPLFTDRTILIGPWGVEWTSPSKYQSQLTLYKAISTCNTEKCVTTTLRRNDVSPDYLYVPKGPYTVRGMEERASQRLHESLERSGRYRLVAQTDGAAVYRVDGGGTDSAAAKSG